MKLALMGCGNMGEAILSALEKKHTWYVVEPQAKKRQSLKRKYRCHFVEIAEAVQKAEVIILAVKPQDIKSVLDLISQENLKDKLFISIAAGITTSFIEKALKSSARVIRVMPNLPIVIQKGVTGMCAGKKAKKADFKKAQDLFSVMGPVVLVVEKMMNAVTAVSGSGPAYVFLFAEAMMKSAKSLGLSDKQAQILIYQTLLGSAHLLMQSKDSAEVLRQKVTSKGGTTQAAIETFLKDDFMNIFKKALKSAQKRAQELAV